jgi:hypothetical protein
MLTRALLVTLMGIGIAGVAGAQSSRTWIHNTSQSKSLHLVDHIGPQRTTLTRENMFPELFQLEAGAFFDHVELDDNERDSYGVYGRYGLWENVTFEAAVPVVSSDIGGSSETGLGDVELKLDLLAFQDIFRYPFVIPHIDVALPTGDEDDGLGTGETVVTLGISVGTTVADQLTWIVDASYAFNGGNSAAENDNVFLVSGSVIWDISDRLAILAEGRVAEENSFGEVPYTVMGGLAYKITRDVQLAGYGGQYREDTLVENKFDMASVRLSVSF